MAALLGIADWHASPSNTFIRIFSVEKHVYVLPKFSLDVLVLQEVVYDILARLTTRL